MFGNFFLICTLAGLYLTSQVNYLLFHSMAEIFSIIVAGAFFMIVWNSKAYIKNKYILFIGIAYLFIAFLDFLHTMSYKGMSIFTDYDYYANQLWIAARFLESSTLVAAFLYWDSDKEFKPEVIFTLFTLLTALIVLSIFVFKIFPICFMEGSGLTLFKKISEYVICSILIISLVLLHKNKNRFEGNIYTYLFVSILFTILSELAFTFYISNYGFSNLVGHYFKLFSFYLIYKAVIETGIQKPYELIFKELDETNETLEKEAARRKRLEKEREKIIVKLQNALTEVKTLTGLIPICSHCKNIRDDKGSWKQLESYLYEHSDATLSHGICPECQKKYYPNYDLSDKED